MKRVILLFGLMLAATLTFAEEQILKADFRYRPPEMIIGGGTKSGPLKDIIEEAVEKIGYQIEWRTVPFVRSLKGLKKGITDIVPRTIRNKELEAFVNFLGPVGYQEKDIVFL